MTLKKLGKIVLVLLVFLVVFDIVGVVMCLVCEVLFPSSSSTAAFYAIWFVLGVFCGLLNYSYASDIVAPKPKEGGIPADATKIGPAVILTTFFVLTALSILFYRLQWRYHPRSDYYVPDTAPISLTFFITIFASVIFAHHVMRVDPREDGRVRRLPISGHRGPESNAPPGNPARKS